MKNAKAFAIALGIVVVLIALMMLLSTTGYATVPGTGGGTGGGGGFTLKCSNSACSICYDMSSCTKSDCIWDSSTSKCTQHAFDASAIASGILGIARIPSLDASKITSGVLSKDRIPVPTQYFSTFGVDMITGTWNEFKSYRDAKGNYPNNIDFLRGKNARTLCQAHGYKDVAWLNYIYRVEYYKNDKGYCTGEPVFTDIMSEVITSWMPVSGSNWPTISTAYASKDTPCNWMGMPQYPAARFNNPWGGGIKVIVQDVEITCVR